MSSEMKLNRVLSWREVPEDQRPEDAVAWSRVQRHQVVLWQDEQATVWAIPGSPVDIDLDDDWERKRSIPLRELHFHAPAGFLVDRRGLPTKEQRGAWPGMTSWIAQSAGDEISLFKSARWLTTALREPELTSFLTDNLIQLLTTMNDMLGIIEYVHDLRLKQPLEKLVQDVRRTLPLRVREIASFPFSQRSSLYQVKHALVKAEVLLSWYGEPIIYGIRTCEADGSVRWVKLVGPDKGYAMTLLAYQHAWARSGEQGAISHELWENDTLLASYHWRTDAPELAPFEPEQTPKEPWIERLQAEEEAEEEEEKRREQNERK